MTAYLQVCCNCQQTCCKLFVKITYPHACYKLLQQVVTSPQIMQLNEFDNASLTKTARLTICSKSVAFLAAKELRGKEEKISENLLYYL